MSTNYYWQENECPTCNRSTQIHIGKTAGGWRFLFRGYDKTQDQEIHSWQDWKRFLRRFKDKGKIINEYGRTKSLEEFIDLVNRFNANDAALDHARENPGRTTLLNNYGDSILYHEFS